MRTSWNFRMWDYGSVTHDSITSFHSRYSLLHTRHTMSFTGIQPRLPLFPYGTKAIMAVLDGNPMGLLSIHTMHFKYTRHKSQAWAQT